MVITAPGFTHLELGIPWRVVAVLHRLSLRLAPRLPLLELSELVMLMLMLPTIVALQPYAHGQLKLQLTTAEDVFVARFPRSRGLSATMPKRLRVG